MTSHTGQAGKRSTYPAYRASGVKWLGDVPEHWLAERLRFRAKVNPSRSELNGSPRNLDVSFVPMESVHEYGGLTLEQVRPLSEVATGYTYFLDGDVLAAQITPCFENGKGSIACGLVNGIGFGTTELHVLRPSAALDRCFLFYVTISHAFRHLGAAEMYGAGGQKRVPESFIKDFRQPVPGLDEQQAIAAFLDRETERIDKLIEKKRQQIELLQEKRSALICHAVTKGVNPVAPMRDSGIEWLGQIPAHWKTMKLGRVASNIQTGPFGSQLHAADYVEGGIPAINPANLRDGEIVPDVRCAVSEEKFSQLSRHRLAEGDIVFARRGEMGRCAMVTCASEGFLCGTGSLRLRMNTERADPRYASLFLSTPGVRDHLLLESVGSTMDNLNSEILARIPVVVPPREEQTAIAEHVATQTARIGATAATVQRSMATLSEHRAALISAAVTGKIDVRKEVV